MPSTGSSSNRILIVDFDVHHGNGTQEIFYDVGASRVPLDPPLPVLSGHRCRGRNRHGRGLGPHVNIPCRYGTSASDITPRSARASRRWPTEVRPELVLISAGFDAHAEDPVGDLGLEIEDFET